MTDCIVVSAGGAGGGGKPRETEGDSQDAGWNRSGGRV